MAHRGQTGTSLSGRVVHTRPRNRLQPSTQAGEVTIRRADGSTETLPPYSPQEQRRIIARGSTRKRGHQA